jgi:CheY-like chemotaxis protein
MPAPYTVLISDDTPDLRRALRLLLSMEGYLILEAADGVETVDILRQSPIPLIVLLDILMPRMSGLEILDHLDTSAELARHVYIVMTSDQRTVDAAHMPILAHHNIPLLEKPFNMASLLGEVARAAGRLP